MTLDEAIIRFDEIAEENQKVIDTGIVFDDVTIDMLYADDTEVIEEHLANYQDCADNHRQFAEWLRELKFLRQAISEIKSDIKQAGYVKDEYGTIRADVLRVGQVLKIIDSHINKELQ